MKKLFIVFLFIALICVCTIEAKKSKKKPIEKPRNIDPRIYCESCRAIVIETLKRLKGSKSEIDIYDVLSNVCDADRYYVYDYPPPDMTKGCQAFIQAGHDETLAKLLLKRKNDDGLIEELCFKKTQACKDLPPKGNSKVDVNINGIPSSYEVQTEATPKKTVSNDEL